jgi:cellulose synthase/poly-beta-1,6-N-acetylglucosamine synthase-like glycosyltransferase/spore germination protein YaaH/peptidoglycan/xylan/chitin deacetylase (PgdA/CDA1 family)
MDKQVFQTDSTSRWNRFKWGIRLIAFIAILLVSVFVVMLIIDRIPSMPFKQDYRSVVTAQKPYLKDNKIAREYKGFRDFFLEKKVHSNYAREAAKLRRFEGRGDSVTQKYIADWSSKTAGIRSAYYVSWDPQSFLSLKRNIKKLNLIVPEWFFINPKTDQLEVKIDHKGYNLMKRNNIPVMPMLTNNYKDVFHGESIGRIMHSPVMSRAFIYELLAQCQVHKFVGINLDLEDLQETTDEYVIQFVKDLSDAFHAHGLYVTQDIEPFNADYNVKELAKYDDYLFIMAYDEHSTTTAAGDISSQKWIEAVVDNIAAKVPSEKLVLGMAAYGYDWTAKGNDNESLSYNEALSVASDTQADISFDEDTYNLSYAYEDDDQVVHQVYFTDAATTFNVMRFGAEYGLAGYGLWRLGSEDDRIWQFYNKDMMHSKAALFRIGGLEDLPGIHDVNYLGDGEVLDVLSTPHAGSVKLEMDNDNILIADEYYKAIPTSYQLRKYGKAAPKELLLTFDDGPDSRWTPKVLSVLKHYKVHAAFFMVGLQMEKNLPIVKDVFDAGNLIGNHTFTHHNVAENSSERTFMELKLTRLLLESITGNSTILFRAPYNADSDPAGNEEIIPIVLASDRHYVDVGEAIDPNDWQPGVTADQIFNRVIKEVKQGDGHIILLHDAGGETREETIKALPHIIDYLQKQGYRFITLDKYLGKTRNQLMPAVPKGEEYYAMQANLTLATIIYETSDFITALFIIFLILGMARLVFMYTLTVREKHKERRQKLQPSDFSGSQYPKVSIIVPAYNEKVNAVSSLENLLKQDYPSLDIIFVDDGSKDNTYKCVKEAFDGNPKMKILTKPNGGKASALNYGIAHTDAEYVVCIDADTKLLPDAVSIMMRHFFADKDCKVGAVAGNVKVGNQRNMLTRWQAIEYTTSQNFDRMAYSNINAITVVPGAIGAFRKSAIEDAGGLTTDTLAEDCDLTIRVLKAGYRVENENKAVALTEAPEKIGQFVRQRTRWSFGVMQTFWKHRRAIFDKKYKGLGLWALPNMLVFQFIIPTFSPIADILMILGMFSGNAGRILLYYIAFLIVDASVSIMAYIFEKERLWVLLWIIPQRFFYRWIMYYVLFKSYMKAIKGELQTWGVLKRTGNVKIENI